MTDHRWITLSAAADKLAKAHGGEWGSMLEKACNDDKIAHSQRHATETVRGQISFYRDPAEWVLLRVSLDKWLGQQGLTGLAPASAAYAPKHVKGEKWTQEQADEVRQRLEYWDGQKVRDFLTRTAEEFGVSPQKLRQVLTKFPASTTLDRAWHSSSNRR